MSACSEFMKHGLLHDRYIFPRRIRRLCELLAIELPSHARVLDVGCGDGSLDARLMRARSDIEIQGADVLVRQQPEIPVTRFNGISLPFADRSFDVVMFVDVLHHIADPLPLLRDAVRVSRSGLLVKDHLLEGMAAGTRLRLMDWIGNARFGVALPYNYWPASRWERAFAELGLGVASRRTDLELYPEPLDSIFGASLHFIARLTPAGTEVSHG